MYILRNKIFYFFMLFVLLQVCLYFFMYFFHTLIAFSKDDYRDNAHHYVKDPRIEHKPFQFLRALGQYDAQWYLKIIDKGYPKNPVDVDNNNKLVMDGLTYAFFPLYPITIFPITLFLKDREIAAFVYVNLLLTLNFFSL